MSMKLIVSGAKLIKKNFLAKNNAKKSMKLQ